MTPALKDAVERVYTDACVRCYDAVQDGDNPAAERHHILASALKGAYPDVVEAVRERILSTASTQSTAVVHSD